MNYVLEKCNGPISEKIKKLTVKQKWACS